MIVTRLSPGDGVSTFAMNHYRQIDHDAFAIDFLSHGSADEKWKAEIEGHGDGVHVFPSLGMSNLPTIRKSYRSLLLEKGYDIVHCNLPNMAFLYLGCAKKHGVPARIVHSHATSFSDVFTHRIRNHLLWTFGRRYANSFVACSRAAGDFLFGKKKYVVLSNGIDSSRFAFDAKKRAEARKELKLADTDVLLGEVGRICPQKNQAFLLGLLPSLPQNYHLLLIGNSTPEDWARLPLSDPERVHRLSQRPDIERYYSAIDLFLLPSLFEGLPFSLIEAQASGLTCLASDNVTREADCGKVKFLPLQEDVWQKEILGLSSLGDRKAALAPQFDIVESTRRLKELYRGFEKSEK